MARKQEVEKYLLDKLKAQNDPFAMSMNYGPSSFDIGTQSSTVKMPQLPAMPTMGGEPYQIANLGAMDPSLDLYGPISETGTEDEPPAPVVAPPVSQKRAQAPDIVPKVANPEQSDKDVTREKMFEMLRAQKEKEDALDAKAKAVREAGPGGLELVGTAMAGIGEAISGRPYLGEALRSTDKSRDIRIANVEAERADLETFENKNPDSLVSKQYRDLAAKYLNKDVKEFEGMSAYQIAKVLPAIQDIYKAELAQEERAESRAFRERQLQLQKEQINATKEGKAYERESKATEAAKKVAVPGFVPTGEVAVSETEVQKLRDAKTQWDQFVSGIDEYQALIKQYGTQEFPGTAARGQMSAIANRLQVAVKELAKLGVLSKSDEPYIKRQIPDPGYGQTQAGMSATLAMSKKIFTNDFLAAMRARGYTPTEEMTGQAEPAQAAIPDQEKQQALAWAQANPDDPRAKRIMEKFGGSQYAALRP